MDVCFDDMSSHKQKPRSEGRVRIAVARPGDHESPPGPEQHAAYLNIKKNEAALLGRALASIFPLYQEERARFLADQGDGLA